MEAFLFNETELPICCQTCKLYDKGSEHPCMSGDGSDAPMILFVGEMPSTNDDKLGNPFTGNSGKLLKELVGKLGLKEDEVRYTNTVRCVTPDGRPPTAREISTCSELLEQEIRETNPAVIVLLGNAPLKAVLGESGITSWNGAVVQRGDLTYVPAYHPAFILRGGMMPAMLDSWIDALSKAVEAADGKLFASNDEDYTYIYPKTSEEINQMYADIMEFHNSSDGSLVVCDMECVDVNWLDRPGNKLLSYAYATDTHVWSFPYKHDEAEDWWMEQYVEEDSEGEFIPEDAPEFEEILDFLWEINNSILKTVRIIGHNIRSDSKAIVHLDGIDFIPYGDTIRISQLVNPYQGGHGLKTLAGKYIGMADYDRELKEYIDTHPECDYAKGGHYGNVPLDVLIPYGARDVSATYLLHPILLAELDERQQHFYRELIMAADHTLGRMELAGFKLDPYLVHRYRSVYETQLKLQYEAMLDDPDVVSFLEDKGHFNPNSSDQMALILFGYVKKRDEDGKLIKENNRYVWVALEPKPYKDYPIVMYTEKGAPSLGKEAIEALREISTPENEKFFSHFRLWKLMASMLSKSFKPASGEGNAWHKGDWLVRSSFNIGGAKTGRLSSSKPNLQNIPTPEKEPGTLLAALPVKNVFTHSWQRMDYHNSDADKMDDMLTHLFGVPTKRYEFVEPSSKFDDGGNGCLLFPDYASAELRVIAAVANIEGMIKNFELGLDPHCYVTRKIFHLDPEITDAEIKSKHKDLRYRAKWTNWTLLYGGGASTLVSTYGLPLAEAETIVSEYYKEFPQILDFQQATIKGLEQHGFVANPFGRKLPIPEIFSGNHRMKAQAKRTGINMPIQSCAAEILLGAMAVIHRYMITDGYKSRFVNTVHDSIVLDVWPGEQTALMKLCGDVMDNIQDYAGEYYPNVDFSWLTVPMASDMDTGTHYGSYGVSKFKSELVDDFGEGYLNDLSLDLSEINHSTAHLTVDPTGIVRKARTISDIQRFIG